MSIIKKFHVTLIDPKTKETSVFSCNSNISFLNQKLGQYSQKEYQLRLCYEAAYFGYTLYRKLKEFGYDCEVVVPTKIPEVKGPMVKPNP